MGLLKKIKHSIKRLTSHGRWKQFLPTIGPIYAATNKKSKLRKDLRSLSHAHRNWRQNLNKLISGGSRSYSLPVASSSASDLANSNAYQYSGKRISDMMR